jgi:hypothetical protein
VEHLREHAAHGSHRTGLGQPRLATLLQKGQAVAAHDISREKNHAGEEERILTPYDVIEGGAIEIGELEITQESVIAPRLELGQGPLATLCRVHRVPIAT